MYSLDIDIGGTFTDGFFTDGVIVRTAKVPTTPHDVTEGFMNCVRLGVEQFDLRLDEFLRRTSVARLSTTIGTNLLVQRKGARIGLLVTAGNEATLYETTPARALKQVVASDMVLGLDEEIDETGRQVKAPDKTEILAHVRTLIQKGAQIIVVSLRNSWRNAANEQAVRTAVRDRYPIHYLRSVPVQLGVEVVHDRDDHARTNSALLNAYIHAEMARVLFRAEDRLRAAGYNKPLLIVHASGGNARVAKTVALNTLHAGPAVAVKGAAELSRQLGLDSVVSADMGGTSFDIGLVRNRTVALDPLPEIEHLRIATPTIRLGSVGLGGGSIASIDGRRIKVGPESAGSAPGPACYGKGGNEPTVTDANLVLGLIDPDNFLGGRMKLDVDAARRAMERRLCKKLGLTIEQAAAGLRAEVDRRMAEEVRAYCAEAGADPAEVTLFSVGGAGPLHACAIAEQAGLAQAMAFPFGSVFSAFGGSTTDVQHLYRFTFSAPPTDAAGITPVLTELVRQARRDMIGEGFLAADVALAFDAQLDGRLASCTSAGTASEADIVRILLKAAAGAPILSLQLAASSSIPHWRQEPRQTKSSEARPRTSRQVWWSAEEVTPTPVFDREALQPGATISGPAIVEGSDTTYAIGSGWELGVNELGFFVMRRATRE